MLVANASCSLGHPVSSQREELRKIFETRKMKRKIHDTLLFSSQPSNIFCNLSTVVPSGDFGNGHVQKLPKMTRSDIGHNDKIDNCKVSLLFDERNSERPTSQIQIFFESNPQTSECVKLKTEMRSQEAFGARVSSSDSNDRDPTLEEVSRFRSLLSERPSLRCWTNEETRKDLHGIALNIVRWLANKEHKFSPKRKVAANISNESVPDNTIKDSYSADDFDLRSLADFFIFECNKLELFNRTKAELLQRGDQRSLQDMLIQKNEFSGLPPSPPSGSQ